MGRFLGAFAGKRGVLSKKMVELLAIYRGEGVKSAKFLFVNGVK